MKVIDLLNKLANGEIEENTKFIDKYTHQEYIFKPKSYTGIYPPKNNVTAEENWFLSLIGCFRLNQEVEIIEENKKIEKIDLSEWGEIVYREDWEMLAKDFNRNCNLFVDKINEIIDYLEENK